VSVPFSHMFLVKFINVKNSETLYVLNGRPKQSIFSFQNPSVRIVLLVFASHKGCSDITIVLRPRSKKYLFKHISQILHFSEFSG
jgi:hypothetical protein